MNEKAEVRWEYIYLLWLSFFFFFAKGKHGKEGWDGKT